MKVSFAEVRDDVAPEDGRTGPRRRPSGRARGRFASRSGAIATAALLAAALHAQEARLTVANDLHEVEIVRVEQVASLHGGMLVPESEADAFLLVYVETEDPCFDPEANDACFDGGRDEIETVAWACGEVELDGERIEADGGGRLGDELACTFVVPKGAADLELLLRGYPAIELRAGR